MTTATTMTTHDRSMTVEERWSDERLDDVAKLWKLTADQKAKMRELQHRVADIDHWKNDPYEIIRFFNEFKGNLPKIEKLFRYTIQWRKDHDIETHLERYGDPDPLFHYFPVGILEGTDKEGDVIYCDRLGAADSWTLMKEFGIDGVVDYFIFFYEYISRREFWRHYEERAGRRVTNFSVVIDLHGLSAGHMRPGLLPMLQRISRMTQDCYAGWGKRIFLLRAPAIFKYIWSLSKYFFDQHIRDMIIIASQADYLDIVSQHIDLEVLPPCVAPGHGRGKSMPGYFENIIWEAGPIPSRKEAEKRLRRKTLKSLHSPLERQTSSATTMSTTTISASTHSISTSAAVNVTTTSMLKGFWDEPTLDESTNSTMTTISAFPTSSNSISTLGYS